KKFGLKSAWEMKYEVDARKKLARMTTMTAGKKDNLVSVEVVDSDPTRAAAIANQYIEELRALTNGLAVTEAQQRRVFFDRLLAQAHEKLTAAQVALEGSGISYGAINTEPKTAAESYAKLRAQLTSEEVKLQALRSGLADSAPAVMRQRETVDAL